MYVSILKKIATFEFKSIDNVGPDLTNDMFNEKYLPYSLRDSSKVIQVKPATTKYGINCIEYQSAPYGTNFPEILNCVPMLFSFIPC